MKSKAELRQTMRERLSQMAPDQYRSWNVQMEEAFFTLDIVRRAKRIMIYYSVRREVITTGIIQRLLLTGKSVALPVCTPERDLTATLITNLANDLLPAKFGLKEPKPDLPILDPEMIDLVVLPGLAFDRSGNRLGHGAGYYDRFLAHESEAYKLGLAYDFQVVPELPVEPHDRPLDGLLTPTGLLEPNTNTVL